MKKSIFLIMGCLILMSFSFSSALTVTTEPVSNVMVPSLNRPAEFEVSITGGLGVYSIYTLTDVKILPNQINSADPKSKIFIYPTEALKNNGLYTFTYSINQNGENLYDGKLTTKIVSVNELFEINSDSNNLETGVMKFYIKNKEGTALEKVKFRVSSIFFEEQEYELDFEPYQKIDLEVKVNPEELKTIPAGSYILKSVFQTNKGEEEVNGIIYLGEKKEVTTEEDVSGFLIKNHIITKFNAGNVNEFVEINIRRDIISRLFTTLNTEPNVVNRDGFFVTYTWVEELEPASVFSIKVKTNYLIPFLIILFVGLLTYGFRKYTQTKLEVVKSVSHIKTKTGHLALKVILKVKAKKDVENVSLIDKIPPVVKIYEKFEKETNKPTEVDTKNRRIQWDVGEMEAGEERVFSYIVYSKIGVVGKFALPEALAVFEESGEIHEVDSNRVYFLNEQTSKDE